jgi:(p)ppGpp synthase/HD superfamily hydrolase
MTLEITGQPLSALDQAIILATRVHAGQKDKGGAPYILHPLRLMSRCASDVDRIVAVLHDIVEDGKAVGITIKGIENQFGATIADAVDALSRRVEEGETYSQFIERCAANPIARRVKLIDLEDNMDLTRLGREPTSDDERRLKKYAKARAKLMQ